MNRVVSVKDLPSLLGQIPSRLYFSAEAALDLPRMVDAAKIFCPVRTGALKDSIMVERLSRLTSRLVAGGGNVGYARHVHDGTVNIPARPFLEQAVVAERFNVAKEILGGALP